MPDFRECDQVYLVPTLPTAPTVAYRQPLVTIRRPGKVRAVVVLPDGSELETDVRNLVRNLPDLDRSNNPKVRPKMPDGFEERPLW